ncbi:MAG TPA: CoA ester lyase [Trebonia sp.]|nr:CoA ester lyase [Trebonia sp.]
MSSDGFPQAAAGLVPGPALLFCPADRPDRYGKAIAAADGVILDLEDGVGAAAKDAARAALLAHPQDPARVIVRVNAVGSPEFDADIAALCQTAYRLVMIPKCEGRPQLEAVAALGDWGVIALVETPLGVLRAEEIAAAANVLALFWGAEDLIAAMRGRTSRHADGRYRAVALHARSVTLLAATAHGKLAVDAIYAGIGDLDGLAAEAEDAAASGFARKALIHPSHVPVVRAAFRAGDTQVAWARRVLDAARAGEADGGAIRLDGQMIDAPLIRQAEAILASVRNPA